MLTQFSVRNYKSIKEEITIDFKATNITEHIDKIIEREGDGEKYLPLAVIYGPNGSGKSNIISALYSLIVKIKKPICAICSNKKCSQMQLTSEDSTIIPFKFNQGNLLEPTDFEIFFSTNGYEYKYNLSVMNDIVIYESLSMLAYDDKSNPIEVFNREKADTKLNEKILKEVNVDGLSNNLPFLSYLGILYKEKPVVKDVLLWMESGLDIINYGDAKEEFKIRIVTSEKSKKLLLKMIKEMDIDIEDYRVEDIGNDKIKVYTKHTVNGFESEIELMEESNGTRKVFDLLPEISSSITNGNTLIIDELDAKIHPKLLEYIIKLYRDPKTNLKGAQLIFTSHDLMTMNADLFRRDEIWFVAKNNEQASQLYSLVEFKKKNGKQPRKDEKYGKQYLEGRYGADPYLKKMINWEEEYATQKC
jgi:AAA15 family ATPase/GTPase